jgi:TRAP-type mannitol/chloroaromatic compound transport system permease large subunit
MLAILALLGAVFTGRIFPVEAAATGALLLTASALFFHSLNWAQWKQLLGDTLVLTGSLMALLVGATIFSLVFRLFGTDRWIATIMTESTLPHLLAAALALALVGLCSWVLDAFEMIFVVIPIVAPPLIVMLGDAQQTAVLLLLVLQLGFLIPPLGYAVMIARSQLGHNQRMSSLLKALAPFILVQIMAIVGMLWFPAVAHLLDPAAPTEAPESEQEIERQMREMAAPANEGETSPELPGTPQKP